MSMAKFVDSYLDNFGILSEGVAWKSLNSASERLESVMRRIIILDRIRIRIIFVFQNQPNTNTNNIRFSKSNEYEYE